MSTHYKLCWFDKIVYKFKLEWPPDNADMLPYEQDIIGSVVQMSRNGQRPSSLFTEELAVNIQMSKWSMSGLMTFEKEGVTYELHHEQFHLRIQKKHIDLPLPTVTAPSFSHNEGSSTDSCAPTPREQKPPLREERRKIRLPANFRQRRLSDTRAVVRGQSRRDLVRTSPYEAQNTSRQMRPRYPKRKLTMKRYYIPDTIYRLLHQAANASEQGQDGTIIIVDDNSILRAGMGPKTIQLSRSLAPPPTAGSRILNILSR